MLTPPDNLQTNEKIILGKAFFWDPVLSGSKDVACATCHHSSLAYADNLDLAIGTNGIGLGALRHFISPSLIAFAKRNTTMIVNVGFNGLDENQNYDPAKAVMFFDNRVTGLELQSPEPLKTVKEMMGHGLTASCVLDTITGRLKNIPGYVDLFNKAFGPNSITVPNIAKSIASFERTMYLIMRLTINIFAGMLQR